MLEGYIYIYIFVKYRSYIYLNIYIYRLISDTSIYLLGITFLASLLHLLFEALAFQSDIAFWKNNRSLVGLSARTVITDLLTQFVVFLFLIESDTSLLVTIPAFIGLFIQMWKVSSYI